jgi:hypothetical protein
MPDDDVQNRRTILDRADRLLRQSKTLRKMSEELLDESKDIRVSAGGLKPRRPRPTKKR